MDLVIFIFFYLLCVWRSLVVRALDLRPDIAGSVLASALSSVTFGKLFTHIFLGYQLSNIIWYRHKLGSKQAPYTNQLTPCPWSCCFGWCLADGRRNADQRRPKGHIVWEGLLLFTFTTLLCWFYWVLVLSSVSLNDMRWHFKWPITVLDIKLCSHIHHSIFAR